MNTKQQEFDIVVAHLYAQGRPAKHENGLTCSYRHKTPTGEVLSCAVGCRIPDSRYSKNMEGINSNGMVERFGHRLRKEFKLYSNMFSDLQYAHDRCTTTLEGGFNFQLLGQRLEVIAQTHGLVFTVPVKEQACN